MAAKYRKLLVSDVMSCWISMDWTTISLVSSFFVAISCRVSMGWATISLLSSFFVAIPRQVSWTGQRFFFFLPFSLP
ncbi:MAG: hypothetical protein Q4B85_10210 [Lachnospiraceae bacterium]|nr:hypothetical protein [Lachnospiraceae bacterium]